MSIAHDVTVVLGHSVVIGQGSESTISASPALVDRIGTPGWDANFRGEEGIAGADDSSMAA